MGWGRYDHLNFTDISESCYSKARLVLFPSLSSISHKVSHAGPESRDNKGNGILKGEHH